MKEQLIRGLFSYLAANVAMFMGGEHGRFAIDEFKGRDYRMALLFAVMAVSMLIVAGYEGQKVWERSERLLHL